MRIYELFYLNFCKDTLLFINHLKFIKYKCESIDFILSCLFYFNKKINI